jgi:putative transposase
LPEPEYISDASKKAHEWGAFLQRSGSGRIIRRRVRAGTACKAADLVEQAVHETLTYYAFPDIHWQKIRTNNPLERIMKEIRRRARVVGAFPDCQSCLNLAAARLRYIAGTTWSAKCYMNMRPLYQPQVPETGAAVA